MKITRSLLRFLGWNTQGDLGPWTFYTDKRGNLVFFIKAPPTSPASYLQAHQRLKFKTTAEFWQRLSVDEKADWEHSTQILHLNLTGYNLFVWYYTAGDRQTLATIERLADRQLVDD